MTNQAPPPPLRANSLALAFQDVITVVLRVRYRTQRVTDANGFRDSIRKMIASAAGEGRKLGYSDATTQMALYAIVGFLDESVLNSGDPVFQDWARRPLQEEMFGGHFAGEYFFRHCNELLNQPDSAEVADALELHAVCLLLGYRGTYAFGDNGEISQLIRRIREKIGRIRGQLYICRVAQAPEVEAGRTGDPWITRLLLITAFTILLVLLGFAGYWALLGSTLSSVRTTAELAPGAMHKVGALVSCVGGLA
jgi:type VI secretion system protein ImpK